MTFFKKAAVILGTQTPSRPAKPWATCDTDQERLNVFLLCAHLDALFDQGLITLDEQGSPIYFARLDTETRAKLSLGPEHKLRWLTVQHTPFLTWHRQHVFSPL